VKRETGLPLLTDVYLSDAWARRTQQALWQRGVDSVIAPALPYAVTEYGAAFSGTVSIDAETAGRLYAAVLQGLLRTGFSSLCVLNSHLEPAHIAALRKAVADLNQHAATKVVFADQTEKRFARMLTDEYKRGNCHAGRYETALLLACQPQLVDESLRASLPENPADLVGAMRAGIPDFAGAGGPRAYFGAPAAATSAWCCPASARWSSLASTMPPRRPRPTSPPTRPAGASPITPGGRTTTT